MTHTYSKNLLYRIDTEFPNWKAEQESGQFVNYAPYELNNCGEFNAINTALHDNAAPENLSLYSVIIKEGESIAPCNNCQHLYTNITFIS